MNFLEAVTITRNKGLKINRASWGDRYIMYSSIDGLLLGPGDMTPPLTGGDVLANDWQVKRVMKPLNQMTLGENFYYAGIKYTVCGMDARLAAKIEHAEYRYAIRMDVLEIVRFLRDSKVLVDDV